MEHHPAIMALILEKRKTEYFYDECPDWLKEDIELLTGIECVQKKNLNEN